MDLLTDIAVERLSTFVCLTCIRRGCQPKIILKTSKGALVLAPRRCFGFVARIRSRCARPSGG